MDKIKFSVGHLDARCSTGSAETDFGHLVATPDPLAPAPKRHPGEICFGADIHGLVVLC